MVSRETVLPAIHPNAGVHAAFRKKLLKLVDAMNRSILYWLTAAYRATPPELARDDSPAAVLRRKMRRIARDWQTKFDDSADKLSQWHALQVKTVTDHTLSTAMKGAGFTVDFAMTPTMRDAYQAVIGEQVGLIRSIAEQNLTQVETLVMQSVQTGRSLGDLTAELESRFAITRRRATLIARDQNNKATATLSRVRQQELGITEAVWMHSHGGKEPRVKHVKADGQRYRIAEGMLIDGKRIWPGTEINCRCVARPVLPRPAF